LAGGEPGVRVTQCSVVLGSFGLGVVVCFPDGQYGQAEAQGDVGGTEEERRGPEAVDGGKVSGRQGCGGDAEVPAASLKPRAKPRCLGPTRSIFMITASTR
jgi:hypothetical protein